MNMCVCVCETHTKLCLTPVRYSKARCKSWKTFRRWYRAIPCKSCRGRGLGVSVTRCRKVNHQPGPPLSPPPRFRFSPSCFRLLFITTWSRRVVSCKGSCKLFLLSFFLFSFCITRLRGVLASACFIRASFDPCSSATWPRRLSNEATYYLVHRSCEHGDAWVPQCTCHRFSPRACASRPVKASLPGYY